MRAVYLGIDIGGSAVKWTTVGRAGSPGRVESLATAEGPERLLGQLRDIREIAAERYAAPAGVCIGTPGPVDSTGAIRGEAVNLPEWGDRPIREIVEEALQVPTVVKNDTNLAIVGESLVGAAAGRDHVMGVFIGTGIGGGLFLNGALYEGYGGLAGEIGHTVVNPAGPECPCGQRGCLERYASARGIAERTAFHAGEFDSELARAAAAGQNAVSMPEFFRHLGAGDVLAEAVLDEAAHALAQAIGVAVTTVAPEMVVLGGGVTDGHPALLKEVRRRLPLYTLPAIGNQTTLVPATLGYQAGAIGASLFARRTLG